MTEDQEKLALDLARQIWPDGFSDECPCDECNYMTKSILEFAERFIAPVQSKLDEVMLEYCPDEMSPEQVEEWGKHQVIVNDL